MVENRFFFEKNSKSGNCHFQIAGFTNKISFYPKMGVFWLNICRNDYYNILTIIFGKFWWHLEISGIWKLRIGKSGNSQKLASFGQFQYIGYFSHSVQVTDLDFQLRISNFQLFWNLEIGNLEIWKFLEICWFWPMSTYWLFSPLRLGHLL